MLASVREPPVGIGPTGCVFGLRIVDGWCARATSRDSPNMMRLRTENPPFDAKYHSEKVMKEEAGSR